MLKLKAGRYLIPVDITKEGDKLYLKFPYNKHLLNEIKMMDGAKWHGYEDPPRKQWSINDSIRNLFQLNYLAGNNPYAPYDKELIDVKFNRPDILMDHQKDMVRHCLTRRQCILACEMGTGKTLTGIEVIELANVKSALWVAPRSALVEIKSDFKKWKAQKTPVFWTYDELRIAYRENTLIAPDLVIFDESTKCKNYMAMRSQAAAKLCQLMREHNSECYIILMSGRPAPNAPTDWWNQCEIACPGFLKEGHVSKFKKRVALVVQKESIAGGIYPETVTWWDNPDKCAVCGTLKEKHERPDILMDDIHAWEPSINEVAKLYDRMKGLVLVKFKKDCLDLPDMNYRMYNLEPDKATLRAMQLIKTQAKRAIEALIMIREISDGFLYEKIKSDERSKCTSCRGSGKITDVIDGNTEIVTCYTCGGTGEIFVDKRITKEVPCPKEKLVKDLLDEFEEYERFVIYAGFQGSIDRCVRIARQTYWDVIRIDGRGWEYSGSEHYNTPEQMLEHFKSKKGNKTVVVANPGAAGMGLNLTASPALFFYSNTFNAEDRIQAKERIHRLGMDTNIGATIIDCIHLPIDQYILNNLNNKQNLSNLSLGDIVEEIDKYHA